MTKIMKLFDDPMDEFDRYYHEYLEQLDSLPNPSYTFYIPSKGRATTIKTSGVLQTFGIPFKLVVEPQDYESYVAQFGTDSVLCLDKNDQGIYYVRQWIKTYSWFMREKYHWQLDDDLKNIRSHFDKRVVLQEGKCFTLLEKLTEEFPNIGQAGFTHFAFAFAKKNPYELNKQVCSCMLIKNETPAKFRPEIIEDTDFSLQMLYSNFVTLTLTRFSYEGMPTMQMAGGNTTDFKEGKLYKRQLKLCEEYPGQFEIVEKSGRTRIKPSRVWSKFKMEPMK